MQIGKFKEKSANDYSLKICNHFIFSYADEFHKLTIEDVKKKKTIAVPDLDENEEILKTPISNLSMRLKDVLPSILHVECIEKKALHILNTPKALVEFPTFEEEQHCKKFMVARDPGMFYTVAVSAKKAVTCDCKGFR